MRANAEHGGSGTFVPDMHAEPALTIGDIFANKKLIKTYVAAAVGLLAGIFHVAADGETIEQIALLVELVSFVVTAFLAQRESRRISFDQAQATRGAVYSPASVQEIRQSTSILGDPGTWGDDNPRGDL